MPETTQPETIAEPTPAAETSAPAAETSAPAAETSAPEPTSVPEPAPAPEPAAEVTPEPAPDVTSEAGPEPVPEPSPEPASASDLAAPGPAAPRPPRRILRAAVRWGAAVLVFAVLGGATAYAVTRPERTRIPGLATPDDGRWSYPPIAQAKPPTGRPRPLDDKNPSGRHYVDVRSLLLTPPATAVIDRSAPGTDGWLPPADFVKVYDDMDAYLTKAALATLKEQGLRHIAARAWTMPDGTRTDVYLLQFTTAGYAALYEPDVESRRLKDATETKDDTVPLAGLPSVMTVDAHAETAPYGATAARYAWIFAGDTVALVLQTRKGSAPQVPFQQTVHLQAQLLS